MCGGAVAPEQTRGTEDEGSGAHRGHVLGEGALSEDEVEHRCVVEKCVDSATPRHAQEIELRNGLDGRGGHHGHAPLGDHRSGARGDQVDRGSRDTREDLVRSGGVELRHFRKDEDTDAHRVNRYYPCPWNTASMS